MAAPNIVALTTIKPHCVSVLPANTSRTSLLAAPTTGHVHKINSLVAANLDASTAYNATVEILMSDGTTYNKIASTISIPANSSLVVIGKDNPIYLVDTSVTSEASALYVTSSLGSKIQFTCSYDEIY